MLRTWSDTRKSKEGEHMSEKMKDGKWYVPRDLGIIKATEEQGGTYYRVMGELERCMDAYAAEMGRFDYAERNVLLSMRVIENHVNGIEFGVE